jgi:hypothetical protein
MGLYVGKKNIKEQDMHILFFALNQLSAHCILPNIIKARYTCTVVIGSLLLLTLLRNKKCQSVIGDARVKVSQPTTAPANVVTTVIQIFWSG